MVPTLTQVGVDAGGGHPRVERCEVKKGGQGATC